VYINDNIVTENESLYTNTFYHDGGGIYVSAPETEISLKNNIIMGNQSRQETLSAGGLYCEAKTISMINNTVMGNSSAAHGGVFLDGNGNITSFLLYNNIFRGNSPTITGSTGVDLYIDNSGAGSSQVRLYNNFFGELSDFSTADSSSLKINLITDYLHEGNNTVDPLVDSTGHLQSGSPAIDSAVCGIEVSGHYERIAPYEDIDGDQRPGDSWTTCCDIGADEVIPDSCTTATSSDFPWILFAPVFFQQ
jgi:hypothetical protein